jgi:DNA-binding NtrC family response regulator
MASFNPALAGRGRRILVADEDPQVVAFIIRTLRADGHAVFQAYAGLSATELAFAIDECHLVITNSRVGGLAGIDLVYELRARLPELPIVYLANLDRSTPAIEAQLPNDVPIIREPFTAEELRDVVNRWLYGSRRTVASGDGSRRDG